MFGIVLFLTLVVLPVSLFAQMSSSSSTASSTTSTSTNTGTSGGVENISAAGGFIGGGKPDAFVGTAEIYQTSSAPRSASRVSNSRTTTTRPRTTTAAMAQRRAGMTGGISSLGSSNQVIRSLTSLDSDMAISPMQRPQPAVNESLARIQGIQDSRVSFSQSPLGTTAVLGGTVSSERERRVAQQLLLLEPGIDRVDNRLEIR
jgi:hypothetical protein